MKKLILLTFALLLGAMVQAQTKKEVVFSTEPQMHCENCAKKIRDYIRFEKGVKAVNPDLETKLVAVQYDSEKTNPEKLIKAFEKIGYTATVVPEKQPATEDPKKNEKD